MPLPSHEAVMRRVVVVLLVLLGLSLRWPAAGVAPPPLDFALEDLSGKTVRLSELEANGPVLVFFYKTFCPTSKMAMKKYQIFESYYQAQCPRLSVLAVGHDSKAELTKFLADNQFIFHSVEDPPPFKVSRAMGVRSTPTLMLFGQDGQRLGLVRNWDRSETNALAKTLADLSGVAYRPVSTEDDGLPEHQPGCVVVDLDDK